VASTIVKKWPTPSLKQQAYTLRKTQGLTDEQIVQKFVADGKMCAASKPSVSPSTPLAKPSAYNPPGQPPGVSFTEITEQTYSNYLLLCINGKGDIRIATEIRNYLDKTKQLMPTAKEDDSPAAYFTEAEECVDS